jgi:hypothetical protein
MQPPQRPKAKFTSEAKHRLHEETGNRRRRLIQALNAIDQDLPREPGRFLDAQPPAGYPNCFEWSRVFLDGETFWCLYCIVSKTGWPDVLWVTEVFAREVE